MKLRMKTLPVEDLETLQRLVVENIDAIEPGLAVVDSRLLLGHAAIDLVARDADGTLVLMALGFKTDETLLLRIVEAYSWCLEYPDAVRGHYPSLELSEDRPPRVVFVVERLSDSFQRKIKQLNLGAVDALEFRYVDINGVPAVYFDSAVRIRRGSDLAPSFTPATPRPAPRSTPPPAPVRVPTAIGEQRIVTNGHATPAASVLAETVGASASSVVASATIEEPLPAIAGASDVSVLEPVSAADLELEFAVDTVSPTDVEIEAALATAEPTLELELPVASVEPVVEPTTVGLLDTHPDSGPVSVAVVEPEPVAAAIEPERVEPAGDSAAPAVAATTAPAAGTDDAVNQKYLFAEAARASQIAKEFGIQLPKDGALTRQWVDFLNQLAGR
jgi:hypothetical protein